MKALLQASAIALVVSSCGAPVHRATSAERTEASSESASGDAQCELVEDGFGPEGTVAVRAELVVSGLEVPWGILFLDGGDMIVTERPGRLRLVRDGALVREPIADVDALDVGEGGLLGIAAHPDFRESRRFYLYLTAREAERPTNRVEEWRLTGSTRAERVRVILDGIPGARLHDGGRLRIGPDRLLYVGTGDSRTPRLAQDPRSLAGKILRLNLDGSFPADNPFGAAYVMGVRNVQAFDWRDDGALIVVDHGPSGEVEERRGLDEINVAHRGDDLGWPVVSGCSAQRGMLRPSLTWVSAVPPGGAAIYTGDSISAWRGSLLVGTLRSRHLHRVVFEPGTARVIEHEVYFRDELGRLRDVVMGPDGHLYVTTSNCDGRGECPPEGDAIYRIVPG